jgi:probable phosphoglycerate mutase
MDRAATRIILLRHGNTFAPGEEAVWVGARTDLALVEKGRWQAEEAGKQIHQAGLVVNSIVTGPLRRTTETAAIVAATVGFPQTSIVVDPRLTELDYGDWEGLSSTEIRRRFGDDDIDGWESRSQWPRGANWPSTKDDVLERLRHVFDEITQRPATQDNAISLIVSSNGIFRLVAETLGLPAADRKMATGNMSLLVGKSGAWDVERWNIAPAILAAGDSTADPGRR